MKTQIAVLLLFFEVLLIQATRAQTPASCDPVLQKTSAYSSSHVSTQLALLSLVTENDYSQAKAAAGAKYDDIFGANYNQFQENLHNLETTYNLNFNQNSAESFALEYVPAALASDWLECKREEAAARFGFHAWPVEVTPTEIMVEFRWVPTASNATSVRLDSFQLEGALPGAPPLRRSWRSNEEQIITYKRAPGATFSLNASVGGVAQNVTALVPPPFNEGADPASLGCGQFQSGAHAAAVETGQVPGSKPSNGPDSSSRDVPFAGLAFATNSNRAYASVEMHGECDSARTSPTNFSTRVSLSSSTTEYWPSEDKAAYAWAHWSPTWKSHLILPASGLSKPYSVTVTDSELWGTKFGERPEPLCHMQVDDKGWDIPKNSSSNQPLQLQPGDHLVILTCDRNTGHVDFTFDEVVNFTFAVSR